MKYDSLVATLLSITKDTILLIKWSNGLQVIGTRDTIYETNNDWDTTNSEKVDYECVVVEVTEIKTPPEGGSSKIYNWLSTGENTLIEFSLYDEAPFEIVRLSDMKCIWKLN